MPASGALGRARDALRTRIVELEKVLTGMKGDLAAMDAGKSAPAIEICEVPSRCPIANQWLHAQRGPKKENLPGHLSAVDFGKKPGGAHMAARNPDPALPLLGTNHLGWE